MCVEEFDHHCPWIGNCVGKRNYRWFCCFLSSVVSLALFSLIVAISFLSRTAVAGSLQEAHLAGTALLLTLYSLGFLAFMGGLCSFHTWLFGLGTTTKEFVNKRWARVRNPFNRSLFCNLHQRLCKKLPRLQYSITKTPVSADPFRYHMAISQEALSRYGLVSEGTRDLHNIRPKIMPSCQSQSDISLRRV